MDFQTFGQFSLRHSLRNPQSDEQSPHSLKIPNFIKLSAFQSFVAIDFFRFELLAFHHQLDTILPIRGFRGNGLHCSISE